MSFNFKISLLLLCVFIIIVSSFFFYLFKTNKERAEVAFPSFFQVINSSVEIKKVSLISEEKAKAILELAREQYGPEVNKLLIRFNDKPINDGFNIFDEGNPTVIQINFKSKKVGETVNIDIYFNKETIIKTGSQNINASTDKLIIRSLLYSDFSPKNEKIILDKEKSIFDLMVEKYQSYLLDITV